MDSSSPRLALSRRAFLGGSSMTLGSLALQQLLAPPTQASPLAAPSTPKATSVILLHMVGAPSQLDLFDFKPVLQKHDRQPAPNSLFEGKRFSFLQGHPKLLGTRYAFQQHGQSGAWISELLPHLSKHADTISFVRSMHTTEFNHAPAQLLFHTGKNRQGQPSLGSWVDYGLGSLNQNLPSYVVFVSGDYPGGGANLWANGYLPSTHQGVEFRSQGEPVLFLNNPRDVSTERRRRVLDGLQALNQAQFAALQDPDILARMRQYEMAFRMQSSVPSLMDLASEPASVREMYGTGEFATQCLYARRLVEAGVRFVELFNANWDTHSSQHKSLSKLCANVDRPISALLSDLQMRGLLDQTLVLFTGEFGRTPMLQGSEHPDTCGRDHHKDAFTLWMAGGGIQPGVQYGSTDELGYSIAENPVHVRDIHGTLLHLLGIHHKNLTFRFQGLDQRLTGVEEVRILHPLLS
ncbi:MAG: hypothetical protein RLZZ142_1467 [Verrucomicrobiota bacterium]